MSQGAKKIAVPSLFIPSGDPYAHIPKRHFYERLAALIDLSFVRDLTAPFYAEQIGRPSLDPVVFFKCMLVAYFENITSDRALEFRLADSLVIRKYLGYGLEERTPDESTVRKTRHLLPEEVFRLVFMQVLAQCAHRGLVSGRALGMDSTTVDANASMDSLVHKELGCTYEEFIVALRQHDEPSTTQEAAKRKGSNGETKVAAKETDASDGNASNAETNDAATEADTTAPGTARKNVTIDDAKLADKNRIGKASNADWSSPTDPDARVMQHADKHTHLSYHLDTTVDLQSGIIVSIGADFADQSDQRTCLDRVDEAVENVLAVGGSPQMIVADKGHHSGENLRGIAARGLIPLISSPCQSRGAEGFRRENFSYDQATDSYGCPAGQTLQRQVNRHDTQLYQAPGRICRVCPHFGVCTKSKTGRGLSISLDDEIIQENRARVHHPDARPIMMIRRQRGEAPFGYFKQFGGLRRITGHGVTLATKKALIAGIAWNLFKIMQVDSALLPFIAAFLCLLRPIESRWQALDGAWQSKMFKYQSCNII
jgi:transposase